MFDSHWVNFSIFLEFLTWGGNCLWQWNNSNFCYIGYSIFLLILIIKALVNVKMIIFSTFKFMLFFTDFLNCFAALD